MHEYVIIFLYKLIVTYCFSPVYVPKCASSMPDVVSVQYLFIYLVFGFSVIAVQCQNIKLVICFQNE